MTNPMISAIVPVYNVERYLDECVQSILIQSFRDIEVILVDDGSKDGSGVICDSYAASDDRVRVIHKENGGLSDARNVGMESATGEYMLFIDSDDFIEKDSIEKIMDRVSGFAVKPDLVFLEALKFFPDGTTKSLSEGINNDYVAGKKKADVMKYLASRPKYPGSACTKLIKRSVITENEIFFEKGLLSEDIDWTIRIFNAVRTFGHCDVPYYYYRQNRKGSITNTVGLKNLENLLYIIEKHSDRKLAKYEYQREINAFMAYEYVIVLFNFFGLPPEDKKLIKTRLNNIAWIMKYAGNTKFKCIALILKVFGISATSKLLKTIRG